ncbi:MAG: GNAT family N-acetyltransferase [Ruminococcus sp.]|nr:GNAT family N-acetyltransferase [Ruminococcus sp.]MCM1381489.1 GNAT family N-acetyltransferase [Muribaculaceae bacterium]
MIISLKRINAFSEDYGKICRLYKRAFPEDERAPIALLTLKAGRENVDFWGLYSNGRWIGLAYAISEGTATYLFYLALTERSRGKGLGSKALQTLIMHYEGKRLFLALEQLDENAPNSEERKRRRQFYLKNGLKPLPLTIREASVVYDVMGTGEVSPADYENMMRKYLGRASKIVEMNVKNED